MDDVSVVLCLALQMLLSAASVVFFLPGCAKNSITQADGKPKTKVLTNAKAGEPSSGSKKAEVKKVAETRSQYVAPSMCVPVSMPPLSANLTKEEDLYEEGSNLEPLQDVGKVF
ncbi:hypothetical protein QR680_004665 [Steinernema hermaphroditum]|uniref:Uncharacterized protein n=1 Tax=Steinernema hermaphroditum TaxID=289476 RepID=A0AA39HQK6_9BILA|nr:hypothetical protein QR680_004665 [Steinernema hermaphroditum]